MHKREATFNTRFNHWLKAKWERPAAFELKLTTGKSIPFDAVAEHQVRALNLVKYHNLIYKIPDSGFQNPFDCVYLVDMEAYIVLQYWQPGQTEFIMIDVSDWDQEQTYANRKSLTEERAREIGTIYRFGDLSPSN